VLVRKVAGGRRPAGRPAGSGKAWSESDEAARQERACSGWGRGGVGGPLGRPRYSPTNSRSLRASLLRSPPVAWARLLQRPCTRCMRRLTSDYGWADPIYPSVSHLEFKICPTKEYYFDPTTTKDKSFRRLLTKKTRH
jgi:hypothetical protein